MLRVRRHGPSSHEHNNARNQVPLRSSVSCATQPDTNQPGSPPDYAHGRVLQVVAAPFVAPSMLRKSVDTAPRCDYERVEELLASSRALEPGLSNQKKDDQDDAVCDEGAAHDEVGKALSGVVAFRPAEPKCCNATKDELDPGHDRQGLSADSVCLDHDLAYLSLYAFLKVEFQIDAHGDLGDEHEHDVRNELSVYVRGELAAFVLVAEEVSGNREDGAECLYWDVPFRAYYLEVGQMVGVYEYHTKHTPKTMPVGKMMPQAKHCINMCIHSIES